MTAAVISLAALSLVLGALVAYLGYRHVQVTPELVAGGKAKLAAEANQLEAERQRDAAVAHAAKAEAERDDALALLREADTRRIESIEEAQQRDRERIQNAPARDVAAAVDELLSDPLPGVSAPGDAGADRAGEGSAAVPAADIAAAVRALADRGPEQP